MADAGATLRAWLLSTASVTALLGSNSAGGVYVGDLREGFDPALGPAVQLSNVGGSADSELLAIDSSSMQVRIWCGIDEYKKARNLYSAIHKEIHGATNKAVQGQGHVMSCQCSVSGQDVTDAETGWATVLAKYQIMLRDQ